MDYIARLGQLKTERTPAEGWWNEVATHLDVIKSPTKDGVAQWALEQFATGLHGTLTNPTQQWFGLMTKDPNLMMNLELRNHIDQLEKACYSVFNDADSNFNNRLAELYLDVGLYGTGVMYMEQRPKDVCPMRFYTIPITQCYLAENAQDKIDTVYRVIKMSNKNIISSWEKEAPEIVKKEVLKEPFNKREILHAVEPAEGKQKGYVSAFIDIETKMVLEEKIIEFFPYLTPRWSKKSGELYGYSPSRIALPEIKALNKTKKSILRAVQKRVDPPVIMPNDSIINDLSFDAGNIMFYKKSDFKPDLIQEFGGSADINPAYQVMMENQQAILRAFYVEVFKLGKEHISMTATESTQRTMEQLRLMAPMLSRFEAEFMTPLIEATINTLYKWYYMAKPPKIEQEGKKGGIEINIEFVSPIAQAQRSHEIQNAIQFWGSAKDIAEVDQTVLDNVDLNNLLRAFGNMYKVDSTIIRTDKEVQQIRQQRQQMQQAQQQREQEQEMLKQFEGHGEEMGGMLSEEPPR